VLAVAAILAVAAVLGGLGTIAVVALWARLFPALRRVKDLGGVTCQTGRHK